MAYSEGRRAKKSTRRRLYVTLLIIAIAVFLFALFDIFGLSAKYMIPVVVILAVVLILEIILLFSRLVDGEKPVEFQASDAVEEHQYLRCPTCMHVFSFGMEHIHETRKEVEFNCPECGVFGIVPPRPDPIDEAVIPGGERYEIHFKCLSCKERFSVGTLGHKPKKHSQFEGCPHCGVHDEVIEIS